MTASSQNPDHQAATTLFAIVTWVRENGEVHSESRLRIRTLPLTMREGIPFTNIGPATNASPALIKAMLKEAALVVGKPFPACA